MRFVWLAMTASIAVEERASKECLRHQGYASAIQNASNPASSQALAIATVSRTGSMLSCSTPMLNGIDIVLILRFVTCSSRARLTFKTLLRIAPRMFQPFDQFPKSLIQRRRNTSLLSPLHDRAIHKIDFRLAFRQNILQHAGPMLSRSVRSFLYKRARIAVQFNTKRLRDSFAFLNQIVEQLPGGSKPRRRSMMQQRQRADRIRGGIENQFGPLRAPRILEWNHVHPRSRNKSGEFLHLRHRSMSRLKRPNPCISLDVESNMARRNGMPGRKRRSTNHILHMLGNNLFVAHSILHRAHRASRIENLRDLSDCAPGVYGLGGNDAVVAPRNFFRIARGIQLRREPFGAGKTESILANRLNLLLPNVVGPNLSLTPTRKMCGKQAAHSATPDNANSKQPMALPE